MSPSFFLRVPFLMSRLLLQCGQRSGGLIVERRGAARVARRIVSSMRRSICRKAYHAGRRICKRVPVHQALDLQSHRRDCLATDLQSGGGVGPRYVALGVVLVVGAVTG